MATVLDHVSLAGLGVGDETTLLGAPTARPFDETTLLDPGRFCPTSQCRQPENKEAKEPRTRSKTRNTSADGTALRYTAFKYG